MDPEAAAVAAAVPPNYLEDLKAQAARMRAGIDAAQATLAAPPDPADPQDRFKRSQAQQQLDKLNDDYQRILTTLVTATKPTATSQAAPTTKTLDVPQADGSSITYTYRWDPNGIVPGDPNRKGAFVLDQSIPPEKKPGAAGSKPPSDPSKWVQIRADPNDPNSKVIALQDPTNSSNRVTVPADSTASRPTVVDGERGAKYSWDGKDLKTLIAASPEKKQIIQGAGGLVQTWDGTNLVTLQAGQYQPKNGDTMQDVDAKGNQITKTYQNGQWGTTSIGASILPGAGKEGDTRDIIQNNYNTTQTFKNGEWVTTSIGSKAIPEKPTQLTGSAELPYQEFMDAQGNVTRRDNPNYRPKTPADIAARVGQIQSLMQAKSAEVQAKVGQNNFTAEDALKEYNTWYDSQVAPQQAALQAAQEDVQYARGKELAATRTAAQTAATGFAGGAVDAFKAMAAAKPMPTSPGFAAASAELAKGRIPANIQDLTWKGPNPVDLYQRGAQNALKYIDPASAAANGLPPPALQGMDIGAAIAARNYAPPGVAAPPPAAAPAAAPVPAPAPAAPPLLPPGAAGVPGVDPRLSGNLNPQARAPMPDWLQAGTPPPPPTQWSQPMPNFGMPTNPWDMAPNYSPGF